jgi:1,4-alpha-glucan branching enzyme
MKMAKAREQVQPAKRRVTFKLDRPEAKEVSVAGGFNEWKPGAHKMKKGADGLWRKAVILPAGRYEYKFVVDGEWVNDPANDQLLPNIFGSSNNVLDVR